MTLFVGEIVSLIIYLADKGYIKIEDREIFIIINFKAGSADMPHMRFWSVQLIIATFFSIAIFKSTLNKKYQCRCAR